MLSCNSELILTLIIGWHNRMACSQLLQTFKQTHLLQRERDCNQTNQTHSRIHLLTYKVYWMEGREMQYCTQHVHPTLISFLVMNNIFLKITSYYKHTSSTEPSNLRYYAEGRSPTTSFLSRNDKNIYISFPSCPDIQTK
jgi:hypothetical protein